MVTTDALNTQKTIAATIRQCGADYVLALKENHRHLFEDVRDYFAWCQKQPGGLRHWSEDNTSTSDWGHGRHEVRRCFCLEVTPQEWPHYAARVAPSPAAVAGIAKHRAGRTGTPRATA